MKTLLVDDSRMIRNVLKTMLFLDGHTDCWEAADGVEALAVIREKGRPDLMLVDWEMPNMDGLTLVRTIRRTDKTTPIIMVTTQAEKERMIEAVKAGVNGYVVKPFTPAILCAEIQKAMPQLSGTVAATG